MKPHEPSLVLVHSLKLERKGHKKSGTLKIMVRIFKSYLIIIKQLPDHINHFKAKSQK